MTYEVQPLPFKPHRLEGLSDRLLISHYETNYGGAVRRLNAIERRLEQTDWAGLAVFDLNGLGRERLIATNSMMLHKAYFEALGGTGQPEGHVAQALEREFGSVDRWPVEFSLMGEAPAGDPGWVDHCHTVSDGAVVLALDM